MSRSGVNLTEQEWAEIQSRKGGDAKSSASRQSPTRTPDLVMAPANKKAGAMNRWEKEYSYELEARKQAGEILWWGFEAIKLKLTGGTFYTPDFAATFWDKPKISSELLRLTGPLFSTRLAFTEVKGFLRDDANVKFKVAAEIFPCFEFSMIRKRKAVDGGGWELMKHLNGGGRA